jgi:proteasome assembly chaperone (PAC2) family protein
MDELRISKLPDLEHTVLVGAFAGASDAASAATWAVKFLVNQWDATQFADVEPDGFYDFTETRPHVRIAAGIPRQLSWPAIRFYFHRADRDGAGPRARDVVLLLGEEPQLRWKAFSRAVLELCEQCHVEDVALLGAVAAEVPHTLPVQVSGISNRQAMLRRMRRLGIELSSYDGPTGVVGAVVEASRKAGHSISSLWGTAPYYVSATPNLPVSEALLRKLDGLYDFGLHLHDLTRAAKRFNQRVSSLVAEDSDVSAYVRDLEHKVGSEGISLPDPESPLAAGADIPADPEREELPSPEDAVREVEALLRRFREESGADY